MAENMIIFGVLFLLTIKFITVACTDRPIIGILAQEFGGLQKEGVLSAKDSSLYNSYIAASYVKAVESSGARVAPILVDQPESYYHEIMKSINGVVIPGGAAKLEKGFPYYDASTIIYRIAKEMNKKGINFPILGICLGFEGLAIITNNHKNLLTSCDARHENYPLQFTPNYQESLLFSNTAEDAKLYLQYFATTPNNHVWCLSLKNFTTSRLPKQWKITSTSITTRGQKFVATFEHRQYPFIALQFHPEKALFEWDEKTNAPHGKDAITANRHFYDLLVTLSKRNYNKFESEEKERKALIYNYNPKYANPGACFLQIYAF